MGRAKDIRIFTTTVHGRTRTCARLEITRHGEPRRWVQGYGTTEGEARAALLTNMSLAATRTKRAHIATPTIKAFLPVWIEHCRASDTQPQTITKYQRDIERHIIPYTNEPLDAYDTETLRVLFHTTLPNHGTGNFARRHTHTELKQMFAYAVEKGVISDNPMEGVPKPKAKAEAGRKLDQNITRWITGARWVLDWLEPPSCPYHDMYCLVLLTLNGLRRSEAMALQWEDIWGENVPHQCTIHVMHQIQRHSKASGLSGLYLTDGTKNGDDRTFKAPERLRRALLDVRQQGRQGVYLWERDIINLNPRSHAWSHTSVDRRWRELLEAFYKEVQPRFTPGKNDFWRLHDNRHICASRMAQAGVDRKAAAKILGHLDTEMTSYYTHATQTELDSGLGAMEKYLG